MKRDVKGEVSKNESKHILMTTVTEEQKVKSCPQTKIQGV